VDWLDPESNNLYAMVLTGRCVAAIYLDTFETVYFLGVIEKREEMEKVISATLIS
jgi:hypothetical protein